MKNKYYYVEFNNEGETIRRNIKVEQNEDTFKKMKFEGYKAKDIISETWGLEVTKCKATTKFNYDNGQF